MTKMISTLFLIAATFMGASSMVTSDAQAGPAGLESYRWKARPLVVFAPSPTTPAYVLQMEKLAAANAAVKERDMVVLSVTSASDPLRERLGVPADRFQVVLVGKDGHIAQRWSEPTKPTLIFALIDRMPMRQDEMKRGN
ncbi:MAG: hypothetical protein B7Z15_01300 [Rhizobiales bacterium 32-66-8]|nr:MAG: hypothetical protein B7Z15_01300 [Rhizobiales bacterium 32-66-8]